MSDPTRQLAIIKEAMEIVKQDQRPEIQQRVIQLLRRRGGISPDEVKRDDPPEWHWASSVQWKATLGRAYLGDKEAITSAIKCVRAAKPAASSIWWVLQMLDSIRQPETVNLLQRNLFEGKGFEGFRDQPDKGTIYRFLHDSVKGWPRCDPYIPLPTPPPLRPIDMESLKRRRPPTPQEIAARKQRIDGCIDEARVWVKSQTTLKIKR